MPGPIVPPPPGLFSMTNGWPSCRETWSSTTRATVSLALPAVNGLMTCIARVGQASPSAAAAAATSATPAMAMALHKPRREIIRTSLGCADRRRAVIHCCIHAIRSDANGGARIITKAPKDATAFLSVAELLARYRRKDLSPVEMVRAVLDQIDRHNSVVNAYCWVDRDTALRSAKDSEARWMAGAPRGLLDGVPAGIKDNVLVAGMPHLAARNACACRLSHTVGCGCGAGADDHRCSRHTRRLRLDVTCARFPHRPRQRRARHADRILAAPRIRHAHRPGSRGGGDLGGARARGARGSHCINPSGESWRPPPRAPDRPANRRRDRCGRARSARKPGLGGGETV